MPGKQEEAAGSTRASPLRGASTCPERRRRRPQRSSEATLSSLGKGRAERPFARREQERCALEQTPESVSPEPPADDPGAAV